MRIFTFIFCFLISTICLGQGTDNEYVPYCAITNGDTVQVTVKMENGIKCGLLDKNLETIPEWETYELCPCVTKECWIGTGKSKCLEGSSVFAETFVPVPSNSTFALSDPNNFQLGTFLTNPTGIRNVNDLILTCLNAGATADISVSDFGNTYTTTVVGFVDSVVSANTLSFNYLTEGNSIVFSNRITTISVSCEGGSGTSLEVCQFMSCDLTKERWLAGTIVIEKDSLVDCPVTVDSTTVNYLEQYRDSCCVDGFGFYYDVSATNFVCSKIGFTTANEAFTAICPDGWACADLATELNNGNPTGTQFECNTDGNLTVITGDPPEVLHFFHSGGGETLVYPEGSLEACKPALATKECNSGDILMTLEQIADQNCTDQVTSNVICASSNQTVELEDATTVNLISGQELLLTRVLDCDGNPQLFTVSFYNGSELVIIVDPVDASICPDDPQTINKGCIKDDKGVEFQVFEASINGEIVIYYIDEFGQRSTPSGEAPFDSCEDAEVTVICVESQEWTYGIDNTGTRYDDIADYVITLSDGNTINFSQDGSSNTWTPQLQEWAANIQTSADNAGLLWLVEPRFVDNPNPSNIDGTINGPGGTPSGLPGAPSQVVAEALVADGMAWRYVNIQICPGQPVPVRVERVTSSQGRPVPYTLNTAGAILGPINKFKVCQSCSSVEDQWYIQTGPNQYREANAGEIPFCQEPCGSLIQAPPPPENECQFFIETFCDDNGQSDNTLFTQSVTRKTTYCSGEPTFVEYFIPDPLDATAFLEYNLTGDYVDCVTGERVGEPVPECNQFETLGLLYRTGVNATLGANIEYWQPAALGGTSVAHDAVSNIFTNNGNTFTHPNAPSHTGVIPTPSFATSSTVDLGYIGLTSSTETNGTDQIKIYGYFFLPQDALIYDTNTNTGERGLIATKQCCSGDLTVLFEREDDTVGGDLFFFTGVPISAGTHYYEILTSDISAWQGLQLSVSFDGGSTTEVLKSYSSKPTTDCFPVYKCEDSGALFRGDTDELIVFDQYDTWCPTVCESSTSGGSSSAGPTAQEIAQAIVDEQRARTTGGVLFVINDTDDRDLGLPAGTMGCITGVSETGAGLVYWTADGTSPSATNGGVFNNNYGNGQKVCGIDLSLLRFNGSSTASDYTVTYEIWN